MWEGRVWCLREQSKEGPKGRSGQLRSLHPKIWVENDRGTPTMESMMQRGTRPRRRGCGAACSCSAPPQGFEADAPTASQSLTVSDALPAMVSQTLGPGFLGVRASRDPATSAQTITLHFLSTCLTTTGTQP